jgi:hypothetical protein
MVCLETIKIVCLLFAIVYEFGKLTLPFTWTTSCGQCMQNEFGDVTVQMRGHVAIVEICRPPYNFFDVELIEDLVSAFSSLDLNGECRASVLAAQGTAFCVGANFTRTPGSN